MKNKTTNRNKTLTALAAMSFSTALCCMVPSADAATIFQDDFSSGSVTPTFRIYENQIDDGWMKSPNPYSGQPASAWTITGGQAENDSAVAATGYPDSKAAESGLFNFFTAPTIPDDPKLIFEFTYSVPAGDQLYAHLWGVTGVSDFDAQLIGNIEGSANGNMPNDNNSDELTAYSLLNGTSGTRGNTANSISGLLTGSGTFRIEFDVADLGIGGVDTADDFNYFVIAFAQNEDGTAGTLVIDNVLLATPEPSSTALLGLGLSSLLLRRKR